MVAWQLNYLKLEDLLGNSSKSRYLKATGGKQNTFLQFELSLGIFGVNSNILLSIFWTGTSSKKIRETWLVLFV